MLLREYGEGPAKMSALSYLRGNSKISIKSLFLDKNKKSGDNKRKQEKRRDIVSYVIVKPFANVRI
ncbi:MAG: hypothetical protein OSJ69_14480 [Acetatifactor sp.]|nr:hypothetical protein [Acetatifactor sp.]